MMSKKKWTPWITIETHRNSEKEMEFFKAPAMSELQASVLGSERTRTPVRATPPRPSFLGACLRLGLN
jgi:hypothetical protein